VVFPDSLAGRTTQNYDMYSGYVNITQEDWLFYWCVVSLALESGRQARARVAWVCRYGRCG